MREGKRINLLGVAYCDGAPDHRCQLGPEAVRARALERGVIDGASVVWQGACSLAENHTTSVAQLYGRVADRVARYVTAGEFVALFGGDHSCAIGSWSGVAKALAPRGRPGLIWIDAHMDSHTPETSPSGALHGMPVAVLLGHGADEYTGIAIPGQKIEPAHLCLVGVRSYEAAERALLERLGVRVFTMNEIHRLGLKQVLRQARAIVAEGTAGFGISIDLDGIDPGDAPGVGSPAVGGIAADELLEALAMFQKDPALVALEVAELNPVMDVAGQTTGLAVEILERIIGRKSEE